MDSASNSRSRVLAATGWAALVTALLLISATVIPADEAKKGAPPTITDSTDDPAVWGKTFPLHYELYKMSADMTRTKHGGSEAMPHKPTDDDPRSKFWQSKSDVEAGLKAMLVGYSLGMESYEEHYQSFL